MAYLYLGSGQVKISDFPKNQNFSTAIKPVWLYVFDPKETHEHISDLDNFGRFLEKIVQKSDFDDFSVKNVTVFGIKAHKAKFLFYFEGCLGIHKIYKDETDLGGVKDLTVNSIRFWGRRNKASWRFAQFSPE